ncbi:MAG: DnaD domain protein [Clostridiales bacterium]|nr:DnaD domain protein [Clostridiales bacterium]
MGINMKDRWGIQATLVSNQFIDSYMAQANGEYVKVYLYVLRNQGRQVSVEEIADALNHTESDVSRALSYWKKAGVLTEETEAVREPEKEPEAGRTRPEEKGSQSLKQQPSGAAQALSVPAPAAEEEPGRTVPVYSVEQVNRLSGNEEFSQLLYIAQKYMNKVFTPRDCQVFAYLYEALGMSSELLEYLVEYCAQNNHTSMRYLETVAISWHDKGIKTAQEAKDYCSSYTRDSFAVMKAFGLSSRKPAAPEQALMDKWFKDYGFTREVVLEACSRTITAIHSPSFQYADRILTDWKKAGVKRREDITELDARRFAVTEEDAKGKERRFQKYGAASQGQAKKPASNNQFHNFKQRDTDYDALMLKQVKEWVGQTEER